MKKAYLTSVIFLAAMALAPFAWATTFTYHGVLQNAGKPAEGSYDIELTLYASPTGNTIVGGPLTLYSVNLRHGNFSTEADFGPLATSVKNAYVGVKVRPAGTGEFISLGTTPAVVDTNSSCPGSWSLGGNEGNPPGSYLGTADAQDLLLYAGGQVRETLIATVNAASLAGGASSSTSGVDSLSVSDAYPAGGNYSFAGGFSAATLYNGSFVWGDSPATPHEIIDSGPNQFDVQAGGGVAINGTPKNSDIELSVYPNATGSNYSNLFLGNRSNGDGILLSAGDSTNSNNAALYFDQYNGTAASTKRAMEISSGGAVGIGATSSSQGEGFDATLTLGSVNSHFPGIEIVGSTIATDLRGFYTAVAGSEIVMSGVFGSNNGAMLLTALEKNGSSATPSFTIGLNRDTPTAGVFQVGSDTSTGNGAYLTAGGVWTNASSRAFKDSFTPVDAAAVLERLVEIPVQTWSYKGDHEEGKHMGPVAEDFSEAFGLGNDNTHIGSVDESGVAFAAIQGLNQKLETENAQLRGKLDEVLVRLGRLEASRGQ